jgi:UDP-N-acetylmuramate--alanine ligase
LINLENAVAALSVAVMAGVKDDDMKRALPEFRGILRRFDIQIRTKKLIYIDDYAHHPEEIKGVVGSVKTLFPGKRILGIFQPHLFTRTRDFADDFARSLGLLDAVILLPIYPAREKPIPGVTSEMILKKILSEDKQICSKENILDIISTIEFDILMTLGAGDIDQLVDPIKTYLNESRI